jgi:HD superfamily phosphodiesterase
MIIPVMKKMIGYFQNDVQRINHALKVFDFTQIISADNSLDHKTREVIAYTAILHDIGIKEAENKYNSSHAKYQEMEGPSIARGILSELNISKETIDRVCFIIENHHSYKKIDGIDFQIIVEADFLVNILEEGMNKDSINNINKRIFKTESGKKLLETMYLN